MMKPIAPDIKKPLYDRPISPGNDMRTAPPAPDIKSPLLPPPVGKPGRQPAFRTSEQLEAIKAAKGAKWDAIAAARGMQDAAARQAATQAAQDAFRQEKRSILNRPIPQTQLGPGKPTPIRPTPELIDDRPPKPGIKPRPIDPSMSGKPGMPTHITKNGIKTADIRMKKGGGVKKYAAGGSVKSSSPMKSSASKRADGCAIKGKTRGRIV